MGRRRSCYAGDANGNMEFLLVIILGLVEEVYNINDLVLVVTFSLNHQVVKVRVRVGFCFFCVRDDRGVGLGVIVRVWIPFGGEVEVDVDVEVGVEEGSKKNVLVVRVGAIVYYS